MIKARNWSTIRIIALMETINKIEEKKWLDFLCFQEVNLLVLEI